MHYLRRDDSICSTFLQRFTISIYLGSHWNFFWLHTIEVRGMATFPHLATPLRLHYLFWLSNWFHLYPSFTGKRQWCYTLDESSPAKELPVFCRTFYCSFPFPPSRDKRREEFYLRTKQCHEGASWTADLSIMTTVKTALDHTADHVSRSKYIHAFCYALCALSIYNKNRQDGRAVTSSTLVL